MTPLSGFSTSEDQSTELSGLEHFERLLLGLHDVGERDSVMVLERVACMPARRSSMSYPFSLFMQVPRLRPLVASARYPASCSAAPAGTPRPTGASELVVVDRQRRGGAVEHAVRQPRSTAQQMIGIEARRVQLGCMKGGVAVAIGQA